MNGTGHQDRARRGTPRRRGRDVVTALLLVVAVVLVVQSGQLSRSARTDRSVDAAGPADRAGTGAGLVDGGEIVLPASAGLVTQSTRVVVADFDEELSRRQVRQDIEAGLSRSGLDHDRAVSDALPSDVAVLRWRGRTCGSVVVRSVDVGWRAVYSRSPDCPWPTP